MKKIVIITTAFPYEKLEPFLETEIKYYSKNTSVYLAPIFTNNKLEKRNIESSISVLDIDSINSKSINQKVLKLLRISTVFLNKDFLKEFKIILRKPNHIIRKTIDLVNFTIVGEKAFKKLEKELLVSDININSNDEIFFYSYWMHIHSYVAVKLKRKYPSSKFITRCHRYDLYEYTYQGNYIPYRELILNNADTIYSISQDGIEYLNEKYIGFEEKIKISRLGSKDYGVKNTSKTQGVFNIVSCSWLVAVKRVDRIVETLAKINNIQIHWEHYGGGELFERIERLAKDTLLENVTFKLHGNVSNSTILEAYKNKNFHAFINVSQSEGIPVSIMEAMSFGIPVIATDVGGVKEIMHDANAGLLLKEDFTNEDLINAIEKISEMKEQEYEELRINVRNYWEENYDAGTNYKRFINNL